MRDMCGCPQLNLSQQRIKNNYIHTDCELYNIYSRLRNTNLMILFLPFTDKLPDKRFIRHCIGRFYSDEILHNSEYPLCLDVLRA